MYAHWTLIYDDVNLISLWDYFTNQIELNALSTYWNTIWFKQKRTICFKNSNKFPHDVVYFNI